MPAATMEPIRVRTVMQLREILHLQVKPSAERPFELTCARCNNSLNDSERVVVFMGEFEHERCFRIVVKNQMAQFEVEDVSDQTIETLLQPSDKIPGFANPVFEPRVVPSFVSIL